MIFTSSLKVWQSKSFTNFVGMGSRMKQQQLWFSEQCRYYGAIDEVDTFYLFWCPNEVLSLEQSQIFEQLFILLQKWEVTDKVKELLFQTLTEEKDYLSPEDLTSVKNDLDVFRIRNL